MTAVGFYEHGDIDNLELLSVEKPVPEPDEVLARVEGAALNHQDLFTVRELEQYVPDYPFRGGAISPASSRPSEKTSRGGRPTTGSS